MTQSHLSDLSDLVELKMETFQGQTMENNFNKISYEKKQQTKKSMYNLQYPVSETFEG